MAGRGQPQSNFLFGTSLLELALSNPSEQLAADGAPHD
jgi:hypothetical protein